MIANAGSLTDPAIGAPTDGTVTSTVTSTVSPLRTLATYSVLGDLVANIAGDAIDLTVLVGPGSDPHLYQPTPRDAISLAEADLIFENGLAFETWLDDLYAASGSAAPRIAVNSGIDLLTADKHADDHGHGEFDPHTWVSPRNTIRMVQNIHAALAAADPANSSTYSANAAAYIAKLEVLDHEIRTAVATLPPERRRLVTSHDIFAYFARDYGFEVLGAALNSFSTETADPSASAVAALVDDIRRTGVPAIFVENASNPALMQRIADEANVTLAPPLYTDALGPPGSGAETYLGMIRTNVATIVAALR
jgi:zinc/manganese transport system substrate-binding protein